MYPKSSKAITIPNVFYGENILSSASYDTRDPTRFILYSGRLSSEKNIDFIVDSYVEYRRMGGGRKLVIAGDGPEYMSLKIKAQGTPYARDIDFLGHVDDVIDLYKRFL